MDREWEEKLTDMLDLAIQEPECRDEIAQEMIDLVSQLLEDSARELFYGQAD